ncbi:suppressor of fused domain protein [Thomasclavelia sp.]|uniref:suppressor of fused domain protein n=1 Tax=Thomasclavelia sp. TaxID=3025757 RepID=UPI0025D89834|nr:suppressor of fused domain protein [Thomasclavelia sp.]
MKIFDKFKKQESNMYLYTEKELDLYEKYIEEQFGDYNEVFHEIVSPDIHLDIIIIPPTASNNYYKLITMGMGAYKMNVPKEFKQYELERAELVLYLPPTWNIKSNREEDYWPIRQLKVLARLPIQYDTWLGYGHTVSSDQENSFYASNTKFCSMMLLNALNKDYDQLDFKMETKGKINFYQLFPLYKEELDLKQNSDANTLLDLFDDEDIVPIVNIDRKNYAAKINEEILN